MLMCSDLCHNSCLLSDPAEPSRSRLKDQQKFTVCHIRRERERKREHQIYGETESASVHMPHQERGREEEGEREREGSKPASGQIQGQRNRADRLQDLARRGAGRRRWPPAAPCCGGHLQGDGGKGRGRCVLAAPARSPSRHRRLAPVAAS